jgi:hypothetical protein
MARLIRHFRKALWQALEHDMLNKAKAGAYDADKLFRNFAAIPNVIG